jgi:hypothetical protein
VAHARRDCGGRTSSSGGLQFIRKVRGQVGAEGVHRHDSPQDDYHSKAETEADNATHDSRTDDGSAYGSAHYRCACHSAAD